MGDLAAGASSPSRPKPESVLVVIPTYNERENLALIVERVRASVPGTHILIVDDSSPDGTGDIADELALLAPEVSVLHRRLKTGLGGAYLAGFNWALQRDYEVIVEMDADGSHAPEELPRLLARIPDADLVLGSRWVRGGSVLNWPLYRKVLSRAGNVYVRLLLNLGLYDATGGYRAYRRAVIEAIDPNAVRSQGYCFQVDMAWRALQAGFRVVEVPITFAERERGESKMSGKIVAEALLSVTQWGIAHRWSTACAAAIGRVKKTRTRLGRVLADRQ
jgi:dolichol-phosphate mannosyltransferase